MRTDVIQGDKEIKADFRNVTATTLGTTIANHDGTSVSTIEHLMAALWGCGVDNVLIEIDGPEVPIMDGSAEPFVFLIKCAGIVEQNRARRVIEVLKPVTYVENDTSITISPSAMLEVELEIQYANQVIGTQRNSFNSLRSSFETDLSRARTFGLLEEVEYLQKQGLAKGGNLGNAIVVDKDQVLNEDGLRYADEFVRHKVLDCLGDLYLGGHILGKVSGTKSGHRSNNMLLRTLFADPTAWRVSEPVAASACAS